MFHQNLSKVATSVFVSGRSLLHRNSNNLVRLTATNLWPNNSGGDVIKLFSSSLKLQVNKLVASPLQGFLGKSDIFE
jgi:hypothetical protein